MARRVEPVHQLLFRRNGRSAELIARRRGAILGAVVYGIVKTRVVAPQKIDDYYVWLTGANAKYLDQFPEWAPRDEGCSC